MGAIFANAIYTFLASQAVQAATSTGNWADKPDKPDLAALLKHPARPQSKKTPGYAAFKNQNRAQAGGQFAGIGSTLMTGGGGADTSSLNLGRTTLLGR